MVKVYVPGKKYIVKSDGESITRRRKGKYVESSSPSKSSNNSAKSFLKKEASTIAETVKSMIEEQKAKEQSKTKSKDTTLRDVFEKSPTKVHESLKSRGADIYNQTQKNTFVKKTQSSVTKPIVSVQDFLIAESKRINPQSNMTRSKLIKKLDISS